MGETKVVVRLQVQVARLPDGTDHVQRPVINAAAKHLETTTNSNHQKLSGY